MLDFNSSNEYWIYSTIWTWVKNKPFASNPGMLVFFPIKHLYMLWNLCNCEYADDTLASILVTFKHTHAHTDMFTTLHAGYVSNIFKTFNFSFPLEFLAYKSDQGILSSLSKIRWMVSLSVYPYLDLNSYNVLKYLCEKIN